MSKENARGMQDDMISRQQAIEAFGLSEKTRKYGGDHSGYDTMMMYEIQDTIENLPTIHPEIVRCEECLYRKICSWEKQGAKFCSFAERREVTT